MRLSSVVETRDEYLRLEMARAARVLVDDILQVRPGQTVAITADTGSDARVVWANADAAYASGAVPIVMHYHTQPRPQMELPEPIAAAVQKADVWIDHAVAYAMYTAGWQRAVDAGVLYCELSAMDVDGMVRCIARQDIDLLAAMGEAVKGLLAEADIHVTSAAGTDIRFSNRGASIGSFAMKATPERTPIMLAGQVTWSPPEASVTGRLVADGILFPPSEVGILAGTVTFTIEKGRITAIEGGREAQLLRDWLSQLRDPTMDRLAHVSLGFNPGIPVPTGRVIEDERAFGDIDFGFGAWVGRPAAGHFDFTCRRVSLRAGVQDLTEAGVFVHPALRDLCRRMGVSGH